MKDAQGRIGHVSSPARITLRTGAASLAAAALLALSLSKWGQAAEPAKETPSTDSFASQVTQLARDVERAESIRAVKRLQLAYGHYSEFGLWDEMAALFSDNAEILNDSHTVQGRKAIARYLRETLGNGRVGLRPGELQTRLQMQPVVTLAPDGVTAKGRWSELAMLGQLGQSAHWAFGIQENEYVQQQGVWKIARVRYFPIFHGPYEGGWRSAKADLKVIPYHFSPREAGTPTGEVSEAVRLPQSQRPEETLRALEQRIEAMIAEDEVRNLQHAYGYYVDRKMWDDVTDLFTADGVLEIAGIGVYQGVKGIRRALERSGPAGLRHGQINDHLQFGTIVTVAPGRLEARARGLELGMIGENGREAHWKLSVFENRYVKQDGIWRIAEMHLNPRMKADYDAGWGKSGITDAPPIGESAPDRPSTSAYSPYREYIIPDFSYVHPVTRKATKYPGGARVVGKHGQSSGVPAHASGSRSLEERIAEARRKLSIAVAYDAVENISSAFGYYIDDFQWDQSSSLFTRDGRRQKYQIGFYVGPERIRGVDVALGRVPPSPRTSIRLHLRVQPVIHVAHDGQSAKLRTRLFHLTTYLDRPGAFQSGMYPNDAAAVEDGTWKLTNVAIDEPYFQASYEKGWARIPEFTPPTQVRPQRIMADYPPDIPLGGTRQQGFIRGARDYVEFPGIKPMWFHYPNPVSGRLPPNYCPDQRTCAPEHVYYQ
jgi:hypothetical protein